MRRASWDRLQARARVAFHRKTSRPYDVVMEVLLVVLAGRRYAVPSARVEEVVPRTRLTPIEGAAAFVAGLMDHRGVLVPVIDGARLLHDQPGASVLGSRTIVFALPGTPTSAPGTMVRFGLLCDLVLGRAEMSLDAGAWRPATIDGTTTAIFAVGRIDGQPMSLLDPAHVMAQERLLAGASTTTTLLPGEAHSRIESLPAAAGPGDASP